MYNFKRYLVNTYIFVFMKSIPSPQVHHHSQDAGRLGQIRFVGELWSGSWCLGVQGLCKSACWPIVLFHCLLLSAKTKIKFYLKKSMKIKFADFNNIKNTSLYTSLYKSSRLLASEELMQQFQNVNGIFINKVQRFQRAFFCLLSSHSNMT